LGSSLRNFRAGELENRVLLQSDDLAWISVNLDGTVARVQVVERADPAGEGGSEKRPANLIASCDGQIESVMLYRGECVVKVGQAVRAGELLVSGVYDSQSVGARFTRAAGKILARTERSLRVEIPLETTEKVLLGEEKSGIWLNFFQKSVKIFKNTGNEGGCCDIIRVDNHFTGFGSRELPVSLTVETRRCYEEVPVRRGEEEALELAYLALEEQLSRLSGEVQLLRKDIEVSMTDTSLILDCTVLCIEDIAVQSEFELNLS
jgi:similar to stage IV sporulation protein